MGDKDFGLDEILHVYVANQLVQGNPPQLPSGYQYDRAESYSYLVGLAGFLGGFSELSLRIPSVICGVLLVGLVFGLTARWFSPLAGLAAAFITAFSPIEIAFSREVRMYLFFQVLFLLLLFLFYEGFESSSRPIPKRLPTQGVQKMFAEFEVRPAFLFLSMIIFFLAWEVHKIVIPGVSGIVCYVAFMGLMAICAKKMCGSIRMKYMVSLAALLIGVVVISLMFPEKIRHFIAITQISPPWYGERAANWNYYRWQLLDEYPIVFGSLLISFLFSIIKKPKLGFYLLLSFFVPLLLHSCIFPMKSYRYILHVLPIMYIIAGVGVAELLSFLWSSGLKFHNQHVVPPLVWRATVIGVLSMAMMAMLVHMPWFMRSVRDFSNHYETPHFVDVQHHSWKKVMKYITDRTMEGDVVISGYPLLSSYYGGTQPLYFLNDAYLPNNLKINPD